MNSDGQVRDIVLLSTADWDNPFWTNKQHVATTFIQRGHRVLYVDSVGLRRPTVTQRDYRRILRRIERARSGVRRVKENLWVWSPLLLPAHASVMARTFNGWLFGAMLDRQMRRIGFRQDLLWTYNPITLHFLDPARFRGLIYHCVDDVAAQPGVPAGLVEEAERTLIGRSDFVFTTSHNLTSKCRPLNPHTHFFSNVCDFDHFNRSLDPETPVASDLLDLPAPRVGFIGALSAYKVDFELLGDVAERHPEWSIVLIGDVGEGDPLTDASVLRAHRNIHILGPRPYASLPAYLKGINVALLPNRLNPYTSSMFPMKFFEYLASGCPVVGVALPALSEHSSVASLVPREAFVAAIEQALAGQTPPLADRLAVAQQHTYSARTDAMLGLLEPRSAAST
jgi:glycosyltransferase involved in cell wall biosynthesis